jgi:hypothetical protein
MLRVFGVVDEEAPREVPLLTDEYLWPFESSRLQAVLGHLHSGADREARLGEALNDVLRRYEARRVKSRHDGPPLRGIRARGKKLVKVGRRRRRLSLRLWRKPRLYRWVPRMLGRWARVQRVGLG